LSTVIFFATKALRVDFESLHRFVFGPAFATEEVRRRTLKIAFLRFLVSLWL